MRIASPLSLWLVISITLAAQAPPPPTTPVQPRPAAPGAPAQARPPATGQPPAQGAPQQPAAQPVPRRVQPVSLRGGMAIKVTSPDGSALENVHVEVLGASDRGAETNGIGQVNLPGLQAGSYRVRFSSDRVITYEREVTVAGGRVVDIDITLHPATAPKEAPRATAPTPAPVATPASPVGPLGQAQLLSLVDLAERELIKKDQARKETLVACSGNTRSMLVQLNQPQAQRMYDSAEALYYVVAGQGTATVNNRDIQLEAGGYLSLPRGTSHSRARKGTRPLIMLAVLSGEVCGEAR